MTKSRGKQKQQNNRRRSPATSYDAAAALRTPFSSPGFKWPDDRTSQSACITSRYRTTLVPTHESGTATTHAVGAIITSNPETGLFVLNMPGASTNIADTNAAGTAYCSQIPVPNLSTIKASPGLIRCTGIGARITYAGTDLQRSGRLVAGIGKHIYTPAVRAGTGTKLSVMSTMTSGRNNELSPGDVAENLTNLSSTRNPDGVFECHWRPTKVPVYMAIDNATINLSTSAGASPADNTSTALNQIPGLQGCEAGQSALVVIVDGDVTASAAATGNPYYLEVIWQWEYIPMDPLKTILNISPSPYIPNQLAAIVNSLELGPTSYVLSAGADSTGAPLGDENYVSPGSIVKALSQAAQTTVRAYSALTRAGVFPGARRQMRLAY